MAAVGFGIRGRPAISETEALELVNLLRHRGNTPASAAAQKIRAETRSDRENEPSRYVDLDPVELIELLAVLDEPTEKPHSAAVDRLHREIRAALLGGRTDSAPVGDVWSGERRQRGGGAPSS